MADFAESLEAWRRGERTVGDLTTEAGTLVGRQGIDPTVLLGTLHASHERNPLPQEVYSTLEHALKSWLKDSTVMQGHPRGTQHTRPFSKPDESRTVIVNPGDDDELFRALAAGDESGAIALIDVGHILQDRFELVELIGEGGMSSVYKATDLRKVEARADDPYVAVKVLTIPFRHYSRSLAVLQREAQKLQSLAHPNIVRVFDCDRDGQIVFMTLEYLAGQSLKQTLSVPGFNGLAPVEAVRIIEAVGNALAFAHRNGIVHGDLKPGNVFITDKGEIKVIDFGIARAVTEAEDTGKAPAAPDFSKFAALTPPYASPEMLEHQPADRRDDIYAFACIACEILTGKHPFDCKPATVARSGGMKPVRDEKISRQQFKAISRGLEFDRAARTPSVEDFLRDFGIEPARQHNRWAIAAVAAFLILLGLYVARDYLSPATRSSSAVQQSARAPLQVGEVFRDCPTCPLMTVLPAGQFTQGSAAQDSYALPTEQPQHTVTISDHFGMSVNEVTLGEFREFVRDTKRAPAGCEIYDGTWHRQAERNWDDPGFTQTTTHPATCVSWNDATDYVRWLAAKTQHAYRLASASEWEYAARAGSAESQPWPANSAAACQQANVADGTASSEFPGWDVQACSDGYIFTAPVGSFQTNPFGLHDMYGNVFEWVEDCWHGDYGGAPEDGSAWTRGGDCKMREMRGGSWFTTPTYVRPAYRNRFAADYASSSIGFRIVRDLHE